MLTRLLLAALLFIGAAVPAPAVTQRARTAFTTIDLKQCRLVKKHRDGNSWRCNGLAGFPIYISEADLRFYLSAGSDAAQRRAATQTLPPFNTIFKGSSSRAAVEWRFTRPEGRTLPYAMIVRYFTSLDGANGEVLVVTRVTETEACHVAYVDALANPGAIVLARRIADETALKFDCRGNPTVEGVSGVSPM